MSDLEPKAIYEQYAGRMLALCRRYCGSRDVAQDMMQDGFIQVFKSINKFTDRGQGSLRAWIERIMINTCLQYLRKKDILRDSLEITYKVGEDDSPEGEPGSEADEITDEPSVDSIPQQVLMQYIEQMPAGYRTIFNLYVFEEMSHKEISELLGINLNTSTSQYHRAKIWLANKLNEYGKR